MKKRTFMPLLFIFIGIVSCSDRPDNVLSDSAMIRTMADLEMAQAYIQNKGYNNGAGVNKDRIIEYVLKKNNVTRQDFDSTISWYGRHIDKYDELYQKVDKELAKRESKISGNSIEVLSNDLWPYSRRLIVSSKSSTDNLSFCLPAKDIEKGDKIVWKFNLNNACDGNIILGVKYSDGKSVYTTTHSSGKNQEVYLQTDSALKVNQIFGNFRIKEFSGIVGLDSISLYSLPFDSTDYYKINIQKKFLPPQRRKILKADKDSI